jgi:superfamily II DNA helicase RecQ
LPAVVQVEFRYQGRDYEVSSDELTAEGVACRVAGARAVERIALGTVVSAAGEQRALAPAGYEAAFEALREWRKQAADGKPAYTVLPDATLRLLAVRLPETEAHLAAVHGIGPAKLDQYGDQLLALLATFR